MLWIWLLCFVFVCNSELIYEGLVVYHDELKLPDLPYDYNALEPYIDEATVKVHHLGHHKTYGDNTNKALKEWREADPTSPLARSSIVRILQEITQVPETWQVAIRNNGGGFVNHVIYWATMCPNGGGSPSGELMMQINRAFGSYVAFQEHFTSAASKLFGSGYVWLCENVKGGLVIMSTKNQDSPLSDGLYPLLVVDIWEHAYYLKHQNKRAGYIQSWWNTVCWDEVPKLQRFWHQSRNSL